MEKEELVKMVQDALQEIQQETPPVEPKEPEPTEPKEPEPTEPKEPEPKAPLNITEGVDIEGIIKSAVVEALKPKEPDHTNTETTFDTFKTVLGNIEENLTESRDVTQEEQALLDFVLLNYGKLDERMEQLLTPAGES